MTTQRFNHIYSLALQAQRNLRRNGYVRRNTLPRVTPAEHKMLCDAHAKMARFTRCFDYDDSEYIEDVNDAAPARRPIIREIWVGARSLGCVGEDEAPEGHRLSNIEHEDQAELTDLCTMLYDDPVGFAAWMELEITRRIIGNKGKRWVKNSIVRRAMRKLILDEVPKDRSGEPTACMIHDDETGEYRPIRIGDVITTAHGSNEDLDALYMDEPSDPRSEDDALIRELLRDRINPNSDFEQDMLNDPDMVIPSDSDERHEDEIYLRKVANHLASTLINRKPHLEPLFNELREKAYERVKGAHGELKTDAEGRITSGRWLRPKDIWDEAENRIRALEQNRQRQRRKAPPAPVDWDLLRTR